MHTQSAISGSPGGGAGLRADPAQERDSGAVRLGKTPGERARFYHVGDGQSIQRAVFNLTSLNRELQRHIVYIF